jgi:hypothetical protein
LGVVTTKECITSIGRSCRSLREKLFVVVVDTISCGLSSGVVVFALSFVYTIGAYLNCRVGLVGSHLKSCVLLTVACEIQGIIIEVKFHSDLLFVMGGFSEVTLSEGRVGRISTTESGVYV